MSQGEWHSTWFWLVFGALAYPPAPKELPISIEECLVMSNESLVYSIESTMTSMVTYVLPSEDESR